MNAAILFLSLSAGGDPAGSGCCGTPAAASCDGCGEAAKPGFLDRLKGRLGHKAKADCGGCDPCAGGPTNLLDALKGRRAKHHKAADCGGCDPCAGAPAAACGPAPAPPTTPADPPKDMPKPKDTTPPKADAPKIEVPKGGNPGAVVVPPLPVTPVSGPKLNGANSPY